MHLDMEFKTEKIPSVNHTYSMSKNGVFKEKEVLIFQTELAAFANIKARSQKVSFFNGEQLEVVLTFSVKNMRRDLDNMLKPVLDTLQGVVFKNDCQIIRLICMKQETQKAYEIVYISVSEWNP